MDGWTCSRCGRLFDRAGRSHECSPGLTLDEYLATGPPHERPVVEAVLSHLATVGPVHVDAVSVGIFLKNPYKFAELRPMRRWESVSFWLRRHTRHRTITRKVVNYDGRYWHTANVAGPDDLDGALADLLTEAYHEALRTDS
jgi:hypothetical protein